jgi:hypothetical protein
MRLPSLLTAALIAILAVGLTGCSRNPVAPSTGTTGAPSMGPMVTALVPDDTPPVEGGTPLERSITLTAIDEGTAVVGRFTLWIRKNSLRMPATITIRVADPEALECKIEVSPAQANDFQSPVILYANMSDIPAVNYDLMTMWVWKDGWQQWGDVSSHVNQQNIVAHFRSLGDVKLADGDGKGKNKLGA